MSRPSIYSGGACCLGALALFAAMLMMSVSPAVAAPPAVTPAVGTVSETPDYSSENWADPWDYSNAEDFSLTPVVQSLGMSNLSMGGGSLALDASANGYIEPVWSSGVLAHGRDAGLHPIDAGRYTRISFRMWSSGEGMGQIWWARCLQNGPSCWGATQLPPLQPGWHTYDVLLAPGYQGWPLPWAGPIIDVRIHPSVYSSLHLEIDWMRLYQPGGEVTLNMSGGSGTSEVWWVDANDPANASPPMVETKTAGRIGYVSNNSSIGFPASTYPPGTYRFFTKQGSTVSAYSAPLVVEAVPEPQVVEPDVAGGDDYATVVRGDPWDFSQSSDAWRIINTTPGWGGWYLQGSYGGPNPNDPQVTLPLAGQINAGLYHRLTFRVGYDGPFGLENAPGGGMVTRFLWAVNQGGITGWHDSQDIVIFPGWQTVSIDMKTNPPSLAEDESSTNPIGWGGPASDWVSSLIYRPHEDPGGRTWYLDYIRLARNDRGNPNFDIRFQDNAWEAGTTAEIWADSDSSGYDGTLIANNVPVSAGVNSYTWNGAGVDAGSWWIYVVLRDADGTKAGAYSTGPVDMVPPPDTTPPTVSYAGPSGPVAVGNPAITATVSDQAPSSGINSQSAKLIVNGADENPCTVTGSNINCPTSGLENGHYDLEVQVADNAGNTGAATGSIDISGQSYAVDESYFTWYDNVHSLNWVLMANPVTSQDDLTFNLFIGMDKKTIQPLSGLAPGQTVRGSSVASIYPGLMNGPVKVSYKAKAGTQDKAIVSQRILWAGNSLDEVIGTVADRLSSHFYWPWYDDLSPGFTNYVMVANPGAETVYYRIRIAGENQGTGSYGSIAAGQSANWRDASGKGGPVEVEAWSDGVDGSAPANVLASQRVLSNYNGAFNEVAGMAASDRSDHYLWTWYDSVGAQDRNWIMVANPGDNRGDIYYRIRVGATTEVDCGGPVAANSYAYWNKSNLRTGPVELNTFADDSCTLPALSLASQRIIWGPSFEEVPGYPSEALAAEYHWTWYDQKSPGALNWVMITNPNQAAVEYTIAIGADTTAPETIQPGQSVYRTFNAKMGGPVRVSASGNVISSQRVLWNGYFNETPGTVLG